MLSLSTAIPAKLPLSPWTASFSRSCFTRVVMLNAKICSKRGLEKKKSYPYSASVKGAFASAKMVLTSAKMLPALIFTTLLPRKPGRCSSVLSTF